MIVDRPTRWWRIVLSLRGSTFPRTWKRIAVAALWAFAVTEAWHAWPEVLGRLHLTPTPFSLVGVALSIFLGFGNAAAYDRWWEARKHWGRLVNVSRSWARQVATLLPAEATATRRALIERQIGYVHALRLHLRAEPWDVPVALPDEPAILARVNRPAALHEGTGRLVREAWDAGHLHPLHVPILEAALTECLDIQGACERIRSTPAPWVYTVLTHRIVALYCLTLPFGLVPLTDDMTAVVVALVAFAFYGLDAIGDEVEEPFGHDPNDLPLSALCRTIEIDLRESLGDAAPPPLASVGGRLD